jgi:hypothetical protein
MGFNGVISVYSARFKTTMLGCLMSDEYFNTLSVV